MRDAVCFIFFFPNQRFGRADAFDRLLANIPPCHLHTCNMNPPARYHFYIDLSGIHFHQRCPLCSIPLAGGREFHQAIAAAKRCRLRALAPPLPLGNFVGSYFAFCVSTLQKLHLLLSFVILIYNISNDLSFSSLPCIPEIPRGPQPTLAGAVSQRICSDHRGC